MIIVLLFHLYITAICILTGCLFYNLFFNKEHVKNKPIYFLAFTGLIVITAIGQLMALVVPVNLFSFLPVIIFIILFSIIKRNELVPIYKSIFALQANVSPAQWILLAATWIMILVINAGPTMMDDTDSYHIQMILWIQEYGTVPGIANLHERFGFNSSWFSSIAVFCPPGSRQNFFSILNGAISFWLSAFFILNFKTPISLIGTAKNSFLNSEVYLFLAALLCWPMIRGNASTANYDFIATSLIVVLFLNTIRNRKELTAQPTFEWVLWPAYLLTVRIINYPLLLLSIFSFYQIIKSHQWRLFRISFLASAVLIIPFLARNVLLSGYPFYPSMQMAFINVDWKADRVLTEKILEFIKYFNRINVSHSSIENTKQLEFPYWPVEWFKHLFYFDKPIVIAGLSGFIFLFSYLRKLLRQYSAITIFFAIVLLLQLISWFFIAPDPRFAYGNLLCGSYLIILLIERKLNLLTGFLLKKQSLLILSVAILLFATVKPIRNEKYRNFIFPFTIPQPPAELIKIEDLTLRIPKKILNNWNPRCYATQLPCLYVLNPKLRLRGNSIKQGFRLEK